MSKFPSLQNVLKALQKTVYRFPLETLTAISGVIFAIAFLDLKYNDPSKPFFVKAILSCSLCFVLFLSVSLYFFTSQKSRFLRFLTSFVLGGLVVAFIFNFHKEPTPLELQQFLVLNISLHLLVSFAGFLPKKYNQEEFWEFNKQLFLKILTAGLYSIVLYCGLALALLAVKELFKIKLDDKIFGYLFFVIAGIFNSLFFLSGVPEIRKDENHLQLKYPNGLKNFTQYVLLPLISLYLCILIGYETKILITRSLPIGWVSYLVLVFAMFGILSFLLVYPIASETGNLWMRTFNRRFYFLLIPLLALLFWAILYRISLYGFTHERYYVLLLSCWLAIIVVYFLIQKEPKIKFIPISLCLAGLFSIVGPQSADSIAKKSQLSRFETYIQKIKKEKLTFEEEKDISSIVEFLEENYGPEALLTPQTRDKLSSLFKNNKNPSSSAIMESLGLKHRYPYATQNDNPNYFNYYFHEDSNTTAENIKGYDISFTLSDDSNFNCVNCITIDNTIYSIKSSKKNYGVDLQINKDVIPLRFFNFIDKNPAFSENKNDSTKITQIVDSPKYKVSITYLNLNGNQTKQKKTISNYNLKILVQIKN